MVEAVLIQHAFDLNSRLSSCVDGLYLQDGERSRLASASFYFVMDCHSAIVMLTNRGLYQPSSSLVRVMFEALVRGYWIHWCADEQTLKRMYDCPEEYTDQIEKIYNYLIQSPELKKRHYPEFMKFVSYHLGRCDQRDNKERTQKSKRIWKALNSYTHAGTWQLAKYQSEESIERNFPTDQVREIVQFANCSICWATMGVCETANNRDVADKIYDEFTRVVTA